MTTAFKLIICSCFGSLIGALLWGEVGSAIGFVAGLSVGIVLDYEFNKEEVKNER